MTWPLEYQKAPFEFERFMVAARDAAGLPTTNMAWTMVEGVFLAFRRRLHTSQAIEFSNVLPPMVRALFVQDWHPQDPPVPFGSRGNWRAEVRSLRPNPGRRSKRQMVQADALAVVGGCQVLLGRRKQAHGPSRPRTQFTSSECLPSRNSGRPMETRLMDE